MTGKEYEKEVLLENYPSASCVKGFVNGPCGGFVNGKCEIDYTKDCVWVLIYEKLKETGNIERFVNQYTAPKK